MTIDLHTHSTVSDGTDTPRELVRRGAEVGLRVLAVTDHDSTDGWAEALDEAQRHGITVVPGSELSCTFRGADGGRSSLHLLAYGFDPGDVELSGQLAQLRDDRVPRAQEMVRRLAADGYPISVQEVLDAASGAAALGRPHLADVLVANGAFPDRSAAFADVLADSSPYYVGHYALAPAEAVRLVRAAGGVSVVAHPRGRKAVPDELLADLATRGLTGIEVDHPEHDLATRTALRALAADLGLVATGGSDFHGTGKPTLLGAESTTAASFEALAAGARTPFGSDSGWVVRGSGGMAG